VHRVRQANVAIENQPNALANGVDVLLPPPQRQRRVWVVAGGQAAPDMIYPAPHRQGQELPHASCIFLTRLPAIIDDHKVSVHNSPNIVL
jgi:hypothetical protein